MRKWSFGRVTGSSAIAALIAGAVAFGQAPPAPAPTPESVKRAEEVLAAARKALGGEKLGTVKTVVGTGRTRRVRGDNLVPIEFELLMELPDKYLRADEFPAEDTDPTSSGFNGDQLIQIPPPPSGPGLAPGGMPSGRMTGPPPGAPAPGSGSQAPVQAAPAPAAPPAGVPGGAGAASAAGPGRGSLPPGGRGPAVDPRRARLLTIKQDYARLALGLFAGASGFPLTFSYAAIAEAPQGRADVLDVKGEGNFQLRYFINSETHLPLMVSWTTPPTNVIVTVPGQPPPRTVAPGAVVVAGPAAPPAGAPKEDMDKYSKDVLAIRAKAQGTPVEHRLYFADYRDVDGLRLPFRLRRAIGAETTEETTFDRFRINTKVDPRKFTPVK